MRQNGILVFIEKPFSISWETFLQPETSWESYELSQKIEKGFSIEKDLEKGFSIKKNIEKGFSIRKILRKFSDYLTVSHTTELRDLNDGGESAFVISITGVYFFPFWSNRMMICVKRSWLHSSYSAWPPSWLKRRFQCGCVPTRLSR